MFRIIFNDLIKYGILQVKEAGHKITYITCIQQTVTECQVCARHWVHTWEHHRLSVWSHTD